MMKYEYRVIPAPQKGTKVRGAKTPEARFAQTLTNLMNELGRDGWEYLRADTLPVEARSGLTGKTTSFQNMLVFRRELAEAAVAEPAAATAQPAAEPAPVEAAANGRLTATAPEGKPAPLAPPAEGKAPMLGLARRIAGKPTSDDGVAAE